MNWRALALAVVCPCWTAASSLLPNSPFSDSAQGTTSAAFLKIPSGARLQGMGGASAAIAEGAEAVFWNPAGLGRMESQSPADLSVNYSLLLESTYAGSMAYARPIGSDSVVAGGITYFSQSSLTSYNSVGDSVGSFTPYDLAASASYARRFNSVLGGVTGKIIRSSIDDESGTTAAVDLGMQMLEVTKLGDGDIDLGAAILNFGPPLKLGTVSSPLPMAIKAGGLWHTSPVLNTALDVNFPVDQEPYVSFGAELFLRQGDWAGFFRFGFDQSHTRGIEGFGGIGAGAGIDFKKFRVDYAWVPFGDLGMTNRVSMGMRF